MAESSAKHEEFPPRHIVCAGAVVTKDDQVLLVRQGRGHPLEGQWSIPWGYVDAMEFPDVAACRETYEESMVEAEVHGLLGVQELHDQGWIAIVYLCGHKQGAPVADSGGETDQARYFSLDEIMGFDEPIEPWCKWIALRVLEGNHTVIPLEADNPYDPLKSYL
jgi:ADP-ribose pyrophosphatase YjhB (NUDIX family)